MKKLLLAVAMLLSVAAHAEQPCAARNKSGLRPQKDYSALLDQSAPAHQAPAKGTASAKGVRG